MGFLGGSLEQWQVFEDEVASFYRLLGFDVARGVIVPGQQIDLVCEQQVPGIGLARVCVECKYISPQRAASVSNQEVHDFISMFRSKRDAEGWTAGVIVSNAPFSDSAKTAAASSPDIHAKTIDDLYEELLRLRRYLHKKVRSIESGGDIADYIPLNGRTLNDEMTRTGHTATLQSIWDKWFTGPLPQLCVLADFGSGKTTFLLQLFQRLATDYLKGDSPVVPLFIPLRDYYDSPTADHLIEKFFAKECGAMIDVKAFYALLADGKFILMLDGFDEMGASPRVADRKAHYLKLATLVARGRKAILTCRPAYFPTKQELKTVFVDYRSKFGLTFRGKRSTHPLERGAHAKATALDPTDTQTRLVELFDTTSKILSRSEFVEIQPFDERQIARYLKQYDDQIARQSDGRLDALSLGKLIEDTYDLEDLARRPILLKLIVLTLPRAPVRDDRYVVTIDGSERFFDEVTPALLYWLYIDEELRREEEDRGPIARLLNRSGKRKIVCELAVHMLDTSVVALDGSDFQRVVRAASSAELGEPEAVAAEVRSCSFLSRDHRDCIRFCHKSFLEYFAALSLCERATTQGSARKLLGQRRLPREVAFFFGDLVSALFASRISILRSALSTEDTPQGRTVAENCLNILSFARHPQPTVEEFEVDTLYYERLKGLNLSFLKSKVTAINLRRSSGACSMDGSTVSRLIVEKSHLQMLTLKQTTIERLQLSEAHLGRVTISGGACAIDYGSTLSFDRLDASDTVFMGGKQSSTEAAAACSFLGKVALFEDCIFHRVDLSGMGGVTDLSFRRCVFIMCKLDEAISVSAESCSGVFILDQRSKATFGDRVKWFRQTELKTAVKEWSPGNWHSTLVEAFGRSIALTAAEVRKRHAATNTLFRLSGHKGKLVQLQAGPQHAVKLLGFDLDNVRIEISEKEVLIPTHSISVKTRQEGRIEITANDEAVKIIERAKRSK